MLHQPTTPSLIPFPNVNISQALYTPQRHFMVEIVRTKHDVVLQSVHLAMTRSDIHFVLRHKPFPAFLLCDCCLLKWFAEMNLRPFSSTLFYRSLCFPNTFMRLRQLLGSKLCLLEIRYVTFVPALHLILARDVSLCNLAFSCVRVSDVCCSPSSLVSPHSRALLMLSLDFSFTISGLLLRSSQQYGFSISD